MAGKLETGWSAGSQEMLGLARGGCTTLLVNISGMRQLHGGRSARTLHVKSKPPGLVVAIAVARSGENESARMPLCVAAMPGRVQ